MLVVIVKDQRPDGQDPRTQVSKVSIVSNVLTPTRGHEYRTYRHSRCLQSSKTGHWAPETGWSGPEDTSIESIERTDTHVGWNGQRLDTGRMLGVIVKDQRPDGQDLRTRVSKVSNVPILKLVGMVKDRTLGVCWLEWSKTRDRMVRTRGHKDRRYPHSVGGKRPDGGWHSNPYIPATRRATGRHPSPSIALFRPTVPKYEQTYHYDVYSSTFEAAIAATSQHLVVVVVVFAATLRVKNDEEEHLGD
eukprot:scaffold4503_cov167-Amphora_coffeaeformis.AAC.1